MSIGQMAYKYKTFSRLAELCMKYQVRIKTKLLKKEYLF